MLELEKCTIKVDLVNTVLKFAHTEIADMIAKLNAGISLTQVWDLESSCLLYQSAVVSGKLVIQLSYCSVSD